MNFQRTSTKQVLVLIVCILLMMFEVFVYCTKVYIPCLSYFSNRMCLLETGQLKVLELWWTYSWAILLLILVVLLFFRNENNGITMAVSLRETLKAEAALVPRIGIVIYVILHLPLCEHFLHEYISEGHAVGLPRALIALDFIFLPFIFENWLYKRYKTKLREPKTLIVVVSLLFDAKYLKDKDSGKIKQELRKLKSDSKEKDMRYVVKFNDVNEFENIVETRWNKWDPIRKSLEKHDSLEKVIMIGSPEAIEMLQIIESDRELHEYLLPTLVTRYYKQKYKKEIEFYNIKIEHQSQEANSTNSDGLFQKIVKFDNYNNFELCYKNCNELFKELLNRNGTLPTDFVINCTGGTSIVTSALVFQGMIRGIPLWYVNQDPAKEYVQIEASKLAVGDLWDAIGEMLGTKEEKKVEVQATNKAV